jgi:hypothetical protein
LMKDMPSSPVCEQVTDPVRGALYDLRSF